MSETIDFGIDLGTTNSAIAQFRKGEVEVFRNPLIYGQSTLPSVVGFRRDKIEVGSKAREYSHKRPKDVFSAFKRKMGTSETFHVDSIDRSVTPIELSAHVLKALKGFVTSGQPVDSAVVTIPASFDTGQSTATMKAAHDAGIREVVLLQEPIAASLAYANKSSHGGKLKNGKWLVYDLGGGTFDVALIETKGNDMHVLDHEGDNFLGGVDFDRIILEKFLVPRIERLGTFADLAGSLRRGDGARHAAAVKLLLAAEEAKIALTGATSTDIAISISDDNGHEIEGEIALTRSELEAIVKDQLDQTIQMVMAVMTRNNLARMDLNLILLVGGSTYMPYVRQRLEEKTGVPVSSDVDPTTAVAVGAAYFAGTRLRQTPGDALSKREYAIKAKVRYHRSTKEEQEAILVLFEGDLLGLTYRLTRDDGGFDTGVKVLPQRLVEEVPLLQNEYNYFTLSVSDSLGDPVDLGIAPIGIAHGRYTVSGQPLPDPISLERDDLETKETRLELVFAKNAILPLRKVLTYQVNRTLKKGSADAIRIRVMEGPDSGSPDSTKCIGHLEISLELSESRVLTARASLSVTGQEFSGVYALQDRSVPVPYIQERAEDLAGRISDEITEANDNERYELASALKSLQREAESVERAAEKLDQEDATDERYQIEDKLRKLSQRLDGATKDRKLNDYRVAYRSAVEKCRKVVNEHGNDEERDFLDSIVADESSFLSSEVLSRIREKTEEVDGVRLRILWRTPTYLQGIFAWHLDQEERMNRPTEAATLLGAGRDAIAQRNWLKLAEVCRRLFDHLPLGEDLPFSGRIGF